MRRFLIGAAAALLCAAAGAQNTAADTAATKESDARFALQENREAGELHALLDGREIFVYRFGAENDLPHFYPFNTPSGKNLLVQKTEPYPHHRAFWIADTVERDGVRGDVYNAYYTGVKKGKRVHEPPFNTGSSHKAFRQTKTEGARAVIEEDLVWETQRTTEPFPLLDEHRLIRLHALEDGSWLMDLSFELRATYGDVRFVSDAVHYAWPYLRLDPRFSGTQGGVITADNGATGQEDTNLKPARWIDYSNSVEGTSEGVALLQWPDSEGGQRLWLTREYGTLGPRRPEHQSGTKFALKKGEALRQRIGVLVHKGDVTGGRVAEIYDRYVKGDFEE